MIGDVKGTPRSTITRMSVILSADGLEFALTFRGADCSAAASRDSSAPPMIPAEVLNRSRRPIFLLRLNIAVFPLCMLGYSSYSAMPFPPGTPPSNCLAGASRLVNLRGSWLGEMKWRAGVTPPTTGITSRVLPVQFHRDLHAPPRVGLAAPVAEVGVLQRRAAAQRAKLRPVQQVKGRPGEVQMLLLLGVNAPRERSAFAVIREIAHFGVVPRGGAKGGGGLRAKPRSRLEEAVGPRIEFSRVRARPAIVSTHRGPVYSVEDGEADGGCQRDGCAAGVVLNSGEAPAAKDGRSRTLAAQELLPLPERQLVHIVDLDHVGLIVRGNRLLQRPVVVVFRAVPLAVRIGEQLRKHVRRLHGEAIGVPVGEFHLHRVIGGVADAVALAVDRIHRRILRERAERLTHRRPRAPQLVEPGPWRINSRRVGGHRTDL